MLRTIVAIAVARAARFAIRLFRPGGGSSVPGRIAAKIQPNLVTRAVTALPKRAVLVTGSAGKSTTTKLLVEILRAHGLKVFTNPSTSNIRQGFFSALLTAANYRGQLRDDIAVLEADEGHGPALARALSPQLTVLTNVMSDQLDRFTDPEYVVGKLMEIATESSTVVFNGDDPNLVNIANRTQKPMYSVTSSEGIRGLTSYPSYAYFDGETDQPDNPVLELVECSDASFSIKIGSETKRLRLISPGVHMALNSSLALAAAQQVLGPSFSWATAIEAMDSADGVFARWEEISLRGAKTRLVLVQNPGSFMLNLKLIQNWPERIFLGIGRDVHDPSWLWTVDLSTIPRVDVLAGFNSAEAAALLATHRVPVSAVISDIPEAVDKFLALPLSENEQRIMIITADAMRRLRRHLRLAK